MLSQRYLLWPRTIDENGACNIPDTVWISIWSQMAVEGKDKQVFYKGDAYDFESWLNLIKAPKNLPVLVVDTQEKRIVFIAWLNQFDTNHAFSHFCLLGKYNRDTVGYIDLVMGFWASFEKEDGSGEPLWKLLLGVTPETYTAARKLIAKVGYRELCTIPHICKNLWTGEVCGSVLSMYDLEARRVRASQGQEGN